jgi:maltose-binding protein MalE
MSEPIRPRPSPVPNLATISEHPSGVFRAVRTGNRVTNFWGALAFVVTSALGIGGKLWSDRQDRAADELVTKHAALEQKVTDMKEADALAHQQIQDSVKENRSHTDERIDEVIRAMGKKPAPR